VKQVVLVVEDDALVRMDVADIIRQAGYAVLEAADADKAIRLLEENADISAIFTDIEMPGSMDGIRLAAAVRDRWPPVKIIATSGHLNVYDKALPDGGVFIPKPYTHDQVLTTLHHALR